MLRKVTATRYVMPLREGGSLPGLVEGDDDGLYVVKFRAAGQGLKALVAEVIVGELARAVGLRVPEIVAVELAAELGRTEPDPEIQELVTGSAGCNCGIDFLPGALDYNPARPGALGSLEASEIVWLDALCTNVDRTPRNPNLLVWHRGTWLIDHGAALYQHHSDRDLVGRAREPFALIAEHVLLPLAAELRAADARLAGLLDGDALAAVVALVPDDWLGPDPAGARSAYVEYLRARLAPPRGFVDEAEAARGA
ncbi:MAG: aminotransferase class I and II [Acidobacteriota bacterium]|nr:aminotransferase class I and II [Acidobacteriota bacterium]